MPPALKKVFKQASQITGKNKFFWVFGLFLVLGNFYSIYSEITKQRSALVLIISLLLLVLFFRSKAALIGAITAILNKQETFFSSEMRNSRLFFNRLVGIQVLVFVAILAVGVLIISPIAYFYTHNLTYRATGLLALGLLIFIPVLIVGLLVNVLAPMFAVIFNLKLKDALNRSFELIFQHWTFLVLQGLILFILQVLAASLSLIVFIEEFPYHMEGLGAGLVLIFSLFLQSYLAVFSQTAWVISFLELVRPQKLEEEEALPVPEVIG